MEHLTTTKTDKIILGKIVSVFERLVLCWCFLAGAVLFFIVFLTTLNIFGFTLHSIFQIFGSSFPAIAGYEDIVTVLIGITVLGFFPYCQLKKGHIAVDFFMEKAGIRFQKVMALISEILLCTTAIFFSIMIFYGMLETKSDSMTTPVLGWQIWYFYLAAFISCLLWSVVSFCNIFPQKK